MSVQMPRHATQTSHGPNVLHTGTDSARRHPRRHPRAHRQGAALVISLFALLTITGLGLVAVQTATEEIQASGNYRYNKQAEQTSAVALDLALGQAATNGEAIWQFMKQNAHATAADSGTNVADVQTTYTFGDTELQTAFGVTPIADASVLEPFLEVTMSNPLDGFTAPGYSQDFCFKRFQFDSTGRLGTIPADVEKLDPHIRYSRYNHRAYGVLGPLECEGN